MSSSSTISSKGRIDKTDIPSLLRAFEKGKISGELSFNRNGERIDLYFLFGQLYHAQWKEIAGIEAVMELLDWKNGHYAFTEGNIPATATIHEEDIDTILAIKDKPKAKLGDDHSHDLADLMPFDIASGDNHAKHVHTEVDHSPVDTTGRVAPLPPIGGFYRTKSFCLPTGEQMATSLVATGPQLEEELLHLAEVRFSGYMLGGPEVNGYPMMGICLLQGRFVHAFHHSMKGNTFQVIQGEQAYRSALDQQGSRPARFYWFYELPNEVVRTAMALLTPASRYAKLEVRIIRFKELLRLLNEEGFSGTLAISVPIGAVGLDQKVSTLAGQHIYIPIYQGNILGIWSEKDTRLANDAQLLQHFLNEPQAFLDLHLASTIAEPGQELQSLLAASEVASIAETVPTPTPAPRMDNRAAAALRHDYTEPSIPVAPPPESPSNAVDDDERQLRLITTIGRMESSWTQQMQRKGSRIDAQMTLPALASFSNEALELIESVSGRRSVQDMIQRALKQELAQYRAILQMLDVGQGRINTTKLLREYELFQRDGGDGSSADFSRDASRGLRSLLRSCFQYYVSFIRHETTRYESQEMYEVFLQDVVRKM